MVATRDSFDAALTIGRFAGWEPLGFEAGDNNWYRFAANGPLDRVDPTGRAVIVCGANAWYRKPIHVLDAATFGNDFDGLARRLRGQVNKDLRTVGGDPIGPITTTGGFTVPTHDRHNNRTGTYAFYFFIIAFDICETTPGEAQLFLDETGTSTKRNSLEEGPGGRNFGNIRGDTDIGTTDSRGKAGQCTTLLYYVDCPTVGGNIGDTMEHTVMQKITIKDGVGHEIFTFQHTVSIAIQEDGTAHFSP